MMENIKGILEALLFVADEPLSMERLKKILAPAENREIRAALEELTQEYTDRRGGFTLDPVAGGFQFRTRPDHNEWIRKLIEPKPVRLSKAALETLAIIAYKQPVIRSDIEHIRGVDSGGVIRALLERKMIRVLGRREIPGRPLIYATSRKFLEVFGLKDLKDLPTPKEIEEFGRTPGIEIVEDAGSEDEYAVPGPPEPTDAGDGNARQPDVETSRPGPETVPAAPSPPATDQSPVTEEGGESDSKNDLHSENGG
jgi:segregation and condensation protein B